MDCLRVRRDPIYIGLKSCLFISITELMFSESTSSNGRVGRAARSMASRAAIVSSVIAIVAEKGVGAVTHRAVAIEAKVSPPLVAYHFSSIGDLLSATSDALTAEAVARLDAAIRDVAASASLLDVTSRYLADQFGPYRQAFVARLELDLARARLAALPPDMVSANELFVDLIRPFVADERVARTVLAAIAGYAVQAVLGFERSSETHCRAFLEDLFARYGVRQAPDCHP